jgi:hypothetical protein
MGVDHLQGRRTGRPRGAKTTPPYIRAARWAYENLDVADAVPQSALAARLLAFWRKRPDRLVVYMATLDEMKRKADERKRARRRPRLSGALAPTDSSEQETLKAAPPKITNRPEAEVCPPEVLDPCNCGRAPGVHFRHCKHFVEGKTSIPCEYCRRGVVPPVSLAYTWEWRKSCDSCYAKANQGCHLIF